MFKLLISVLLSIRKGLKDSSEDLIWSNRIACDTFISMITMYSSVSVETGNNNVMLVIEVKKEKTDMDINRIY